MELTVGRKGSKMSSRRLVVAEAGGMMVQRRRWIGMEQMMGAFKAVALKEQNVGTGVGGGSTSTPAAETGEQDFDPRRADGGGAAVEMDRDGAVKLTRSQKRHAQRQRATQRPQASD